MSDRDALHNRRAMYERLLAARDTATDLDRVELDEAVSRCGSKLEAAISASRAFLKSAKVRRSALSEYVPSKGSVVGTGVRVGHHVLHPALATRGRLRRATTSLKRELRGARRAKCLLDESSDALARACALASVLESSRSRSRNTWRSLLGGDTDTATMQAHWCSAARGVSEARMLSTLVKQLLPHSVVDCILQGGDSNTANRLRSELDGCREALRGFVTRASEQLTALLGALAAAEEFVLAIRELIVKQGGISVPGTPCTLTKHARERALNALQANSTTSTSTNSRSTNSSAATTTPRTLIRIH